MSLYDYLCAVFPIERRKKGEATAGMRTGKKRTLPLVPYFTTLRRHDVALGRKKKEKKEADLPETL